MAKETRASSQAVQSENDGKTVAGYAAVFNSPTDICGLWTEVIEPGAFSSALKEGRDVLALYSHELERLLGRQSAGTLRLSEDDKGLAVEIDLPDTSDGRDVAVLVQRGDLKGMSFGFCVTKQEWDETVTPPKRTIMAVDLYEVTITADPAYPDAEIGMAELAEARSARKAKNFSAAAKRVARKMTVDLRARRLASKA
jgi:HK97 family phage prohead protease